MKSDKRQKAIELRKKGYSLNEITDKLKVAKSSVSLWVRGLSISDLARRRLYLRGVTGRLRAAEVKLKEVNRKDEFYLMRGRKIVADLPANKNYQKILCAMIYWCEGVKSVEYGMCFMNSDPKLIKLFLKLLRENFEIREERFKALLHLHKYHNIDKEVAFWSEITHINKQQFLKTYIKENTGKRVRDNYRGCLSVRYYSADLARELSALGKVFLSEGA
ncbi:MAG: hypothetical protein HZB99_03020 [Candidatus Harrisonbacteria bacterium]|nr:hypothetical protein [Candidatus Harrisonbacteria bacterium]